MVFNLKPRPKRSKKIAHEYEHDIVDWLYGEEEETYTTLGIFGEDFPASIRAMRWIEAKADARYSWAKEGMRADDSVWLTDEEEKTIKDRNELLRICTVRKEYARIFINYTRRV